ncbi:hypothetical protein AMJ44_02210 [candidate division WOR-1 bacterium DG_54_3]|uniref:Glycosyltransferase n=1 Tax=candidate division WOR-1 bacterium DG_54_3 TaxID=1703775 RepID=A0A0S7Y546_UNCSA|nr:MAG: hypothetical protein AMJ44_02210 [candidate division WOR-1 bacterium DG_54_3]
MGKIRIVHIVLSMNQGGLENGIVNLANNMRGSIFENIICCLSEGGEFIKRLNNSVKVVTMHKKPGNDLSLYLRLIRLLIEFRPAVVHTRNWAGIDGIICAKMARVPIIIHGEHGFETKDLLRQDKKRRLIRKIILSTMVNRVVTVSQNLKNRLFNELGIPLKKIVHIPNGVDAKKFRPKEKETIRQRIGFNEDSFIVGIIARLDPIKNHRTLIYAFKEISNVYSDVELIIVGDGPLRQMLEQEVNKLNIEGKVVFLGKKSGVSEIYNIFDVFVLSSLNEGMSNTILEAMATGIPVIASNVGGNPELVVDGETGLLFPPQDVSSLLECIKGYILNPSCKHGHGDNARRRVLEKFTIDRMVKSYEQLYLDLVEALL